MCATCGCGSNSDARMLNLQTGLVRPLGDREHPEHHHDDHQHDHGHLHSHGHGEGHAHDHEHGYHHHDHDHGHPHGHDHPHSHDHSHHHEGDCQHHHDHDHDDHQHHHADGRRTTVVELEAHLLAKNDKLAMRNRGWFEGREILALNIVSSPGAGKTTLLERTIQDLKDEIPIFVIEGDQATANDGERIRAAGAAAVQVNTGTGCHLEADMVAQALEELRPPSGAMVLIENVGNLVCPALFDLGEHAKVIVLSVTEGQDKPLKYPNMFQAANLMIVSKTDLLPYVDFDMDVALANARAVNPAIEAIALSVRNGEGVDQWYGWLRSHRRSLGHSSSIAPQRSAAHKS
ncbi:hydrogenase nickel incorporation protein HypB [Mesorhizobium sp. VK2B]|uniref:Hydrogenase maturation factor HypB n=1 Tax=Mesorhizobium humile TaxID=3072313 RepID=A0ABU4YKZ0_9HYPH|nr:MULTISPECIES: hydrogenase nickel incorporation protein HypB [unclassified Mesorhizobium]MDX8462407.1 hydrogenase nickel incorporation protein HypB [Mesorhizobium sp. VK2D]MDX8487607.1 hydrogenase nickel incorporation protein HypB [Mesorhizobium sp. VK2B]